MSSIMYQIKDFIQNFIEITCSVIEFDIYVVDENLTRIAGTGAFKKLIGLSLPKGCANDYVIKSGKLMIMDNPLENEVCSQCPIRPTGNCLKEHMIIFPITGEGKTYGNITIIALTEELKIKMKKMREKLIAFLEKLGEAIKGKIKEKESTDRFITVLDAISEGIVLTDFSGKVLQYNSIMGKMFNNKENIKSILPNNFFVNGINEIKSLDNSEFEVDLKSSIKELKMFLSIKNIDTNNVESDILFIFRQKKELSNIAYKLLADASHLNINIETIKGDSKLINQTKKLAEQAARYNSNVLILGESGTGKELFARAIHQMSKRKNEPFIAINCAAIPENLLESELFGYESGAFTGAKKSGKPGKFELANGGTIFLDEIGDLSLHLQPKLLRAIEYGQIERVGGVNSIKLDVRIIAATNKDLEKMVQDGEFREDLFYRLCVIPIVISPLRKRPEDIITLAEFFLNKYNEKFSKNIRGISDDVKKRFLLYDWSGNVRELENVIEYCVNVETSDMLSLESIPEKVSYKNETCEDMNLQLTRKKYIEKLLVKYGSTLEGKEKIAEEMGISLSTLYRNLKKYKLQ
ncbi:sigma 54-interacting transcriptional regulator [uncultured Clostridium sp.]|uniref:sigma-54 interaction domain-containing protein n=1 Tax=uncultured Clostridium sp. TaxID=59620 RepID=UPI003217833D